MAPHESTWDGLPVRAPVQVARVLDLLDGHGAKATFFVLGWFADRHPATVREVAARGHEVASHSYGHPLLYRLTRAEVLADLVRGRETLEQLLGRAVLGFRAPGFSITPRNPWALDCVLEAGFRYDSSLFPAVRAHGGFPGVRRVPHRVRTPGGASLVEVPVSTVRVARINIPFGGGGYLRLAPAVVTESLARYTTGDGSPFVSYVHPRDLDEATPRLPLSPWRAFKCYVGLRRTSAKLDRLLRRFANRRYDEYLRETGLVAS